MPTGDSPLRGRLAALAVAGAVVLTAGVALVTACRNGDSNCELGATRCDRGYVWRCERDWSDIDYRDLWSQTDCHGPDLCVVPPGGPAMCVASPTPSAVCAPPSGSLCDGNAAVQCAYGYETSRTVCGAADAGYPPSDTQCVTSASAPPTCVPPGPRLPACSDGHADVVCDGTDAVECANGYPAVRVHCAACRVDTAGHVVCTGDLGDPCATDRDCAQGLTCHAFDRGAACSTPCSGDAGAGAADPTCYAAFGTDGPKASWRNPVAAEGQAVVCVGGWCRW